MTEPPKKAEPSKKTDPPKKSTTTKSRNQFKFDPLQQAPKNLPQQSQPSDKKSPPDQTDPRNPGVSKGKTWKASQNIQPSAAMRDLISGMQDIDDTTDTPVPSTEVSTPIAPQDLPAVISKQLAAAGVQNPDWHIVSNLPGNMKQAIMTLGKQLFGSLTRTPVSDITMLGNVMGQGPNTGRELNAVSNWIVKNGKNLGPGEIDFFRSIPGYVADINQYSLAGVRWMLVQDDFGQYIYAWPEEHSLDIQTSQPSITNLKKAKSLPRRT